MLKGYKVMNMMQIANWTIIEKLQAFVHSLYFMLKESKEI